MANMMDMSRNLKESVVELREKRQLTQSALARLAGLPRSTITLLESGSANPSLETLAKVASALQTGLDELLSAPRPKVVLLKNADVPCKMHSKSGVCVKEILPDVIPGVDVEEFIFSPESFRKGVPHKEGTKEYTLCTSGRFEIEVNLKKYVIGQGDVIAFPGHSQHSYRNLFKKESRFISVLVFAPHVL